METQSWLILLTKFTFLLLVFQTISTTSAENPKNGKRNVELIVGLQSDSSFYRMNLDGTNIEKVPGSLNLNSTSIAYSSDFDQLFSVRHKGKFINRQFLNNDTELKQLGNDVSLKEPISIVIDTYGQKLYAADNEAGKINIFDLSKNMETYIPLYDCGGLMESISVDSNEGFLFMATIASQSRYSQIIRMNIDGSDQVVVYKESIQRYFDRISALQIDEKSKKLYFRIKKFVEGETGENQKVLNLIKSIDYDGKNIINITEYLTDYSESSTLDNSLDIYEDEIFWTEKNTIKHCHLSADFACKNDSIKQLYVSSNGQNINTLKIIRPKLARTSESPCGKDNGGCEHMCLENRSDYSCACNVTWELAANKKNCHPVEEFLLSNSKKRVVRGYSFGNAQDKLIYPVYDNSAIVLNDIDYDYREGLIFYSAWFIERSSVVGKICRRSLYHANQEACFQKSLTLHISYDWKSKNLYYSWSPNIYVTSMEENSKSKIIHTEAANDTVIEDMAVSPIEERIYFVKHEKSLNRSAIVKMKTDGTEATEIVKRNSDGISIERLAMDFPERRIFWLEKGDAGVFNIGNLKFDQTDEKLFSVDLASFKCLPSSFTIHDDHVFMSCGGNFSGVLKIDKTTGKDIEIFISDITPKIKTFSLKAQPM